MFIKAYANGGRGKAGTTASEINRQFGIGRKNPQSRYYERTGTSGMGGNSRTRGRQATIRRVRGR